MLPENISQHICCIFYDFAYTVVRSIWITVFFVSTKKEFFQQYIQILLKYDYTSVPSFLGVRFFVLFHITNKCKVPRCRSTPCIILNLRTSRNPQLALFCSSQFNFSFHSKNINWIILKVCEKVMYIVCLFCEQQTQILYSALICYCLTFLSKTLYFIITFLKSIFSSYYIHFIFWVEIVNYR